MNGFHPDWVGALTCGVLIWLALVVAIRVSPQRKPSTKVMLLAIGSAAVLAIVARTVLRHFGI
jgi:hypothetical protein